VNRADDEGGLSLSEGHRMLPFALLVRLEARPGKEAEVEQLLHDALPLIQLEPATAEWYALRLGPTQFAVFDAFPDEEARQTHLTGDVVKTFTERADELLTGPPRVEWADVVAHRIML
jgi:quinol monooxygenase YgiN